MLNGLDARAQVKVRDKRQDRGGLTSRERTVGWAKPTGRANARPTTGSACPPSGNEYAEKMVGTAPARLCPPCGTALVCSVPHTFRSRENQIWLAKTRNCIDELP